MKHTASRLIDKHLAAKCESDDYAKFIVNDIDREILCVCVKPVLEKFGESYLLTPLYLDTIDDPSQDTIDVRKSVDITPVTKCIDCKFLDMKIYMKEAGIWRKEYRCKMDHWPKGLDSFFCADGRPKEKDKED